jgi:hypothetical protein
MNANVGLIDRIVRIVIGVALIATPFRSVSSTGWNWVVDRCHSATTAIFSICPAYSLLGLSTCSTKVPSH